MLILYAKSMHKHLHKRFIFGFLLGLGAVVYVGCASYKTEKYNKFLINSYQEQIKQLLHENSFLENILNQKEDELNVLSNENSKFKLQIEDLNSQISELKEANKDNSRVYLGKFTLTYYCISGKTATGVPTIEDVTVAVDPTVVPLHSALYIDGLGVRIAHDTGGAIKGNKIDVYVSNYNEAVQNGVTKNVDVWLIK